MSKFEAGQRVFNPKRNLLGMIVLIKGDEAIIRYEKLDDPKAPHDIDKLSDLADAPTNGTYTEVSEKKRK